MSEFSLPSLGWDNFFQQQLVAELPAGQAPVRVVGVERSVWQAIGEAGDVQLHANDTPVAVGDWLIADTTESRPLSLLERKTVFKRRAPGTDRREQLIAANVDTLFVVSSCNQDFNEARLERYLAIAHDAGAMPVVVLTKADTCEDPQEFAMLAGRLSPGLLVETINALDSSTLAGLEAWLGAGQTIALLGSSGVGKSTLTNTLSGSTELHTKAVREDDDKGRHTTTSRHMYQLPGGAWIIDTPGMRELQLVDVQDGIDDVFEEISRLASDCRFVDCSHESEPGCAVLAAVEDGSVDPDRLKRWRKLVREEAMNRESIAERRARGKALGKFYKATLGDSHARKGRN